MLNIFSWVWRRDATPATPELSCEAIMEEFVHVEKEAQLAKLRILVQNTLDKLPELPTHRLARRASFCCVPDSRQFVRDLDTAAARPAAPASQAESSQTAKSDVNPYDKAVTTKVVKTRRQIKKTHYFFGIDILGPRGNMRGNTELTLLGDTVFCSTQALRDLPRWEANAEFQLKHQAISLSRAKDSSHGEVCLGQTAYPQGVLKVLERVYGAVGRDPVQFKSLTAFLHQGPYNDMMYSMMADVQAEWGAVLAPARERERAFHVIAGGNNDNTIRKISMTMKGVFDSGLLPGDRFIERGRSLALGAYSATTVIDLMTGTGYVTTNVEVFFPEIVKSF